MLIVEEDIAYIKWGQCSLKLNDIINYDIFENEFSR